MIRKSNHLWLRHLLKVITVNIVLSALNFDDKWHQIFIRLPNNKHVFIVWRLKGAEECCVIFIISE